MKNRNDKNNKKVKTYCYGNLHEFNNRKNAMTFYYEGIINSEGSERDRYLEVYNKLKGNIEPFCDFDGVPNN